MADCNGGGVAWYPKDVLTAMFDFMNIEYYMRSARKMGWHAHTQSIHISTVLVHKTYIHNYAARNRISIECHFHTAHNFRPNFPVKLVNAVWLLRAPIIARKHTNNPTTLMTMRRGMDIFCLAAVLHWVVVHVFIFAPGGFVMSDGLCVSYLAICRRNEYVRICSRARILFVE